jgi:hypothetical protein
MAIGIMAKKMENQELQVRLRELTIINPSSGCLFSLNFRDIFYSEHSNAIFCDMTLDVIERNSCNCCYSMSIRGLIIWSLLSQQLVVATTTKPRLGHLAPASEVAGGHKYHTI